ncbi:MAG: hypothetical protein V1696_03085 [Candidatus Jorgensenbacteria bacterium]
MVWIVGTLAFLMLLQFGRLFALWGIAPDLPLVFFFALGVSRAPFPVFGAALVGFIALSFLWAPFWIVQAAAVGVVAVLGYVAVRHLTGNRWVDMALLAGAGTLVYALGGYVLGFAPLSWGVLGEAVYNTLAGFLALALLPRRGIFSSA